MTLSRLNGTQCLAAPLITHSRFADTIFSPFWRIVVKLGVLRLDTSEPARLKRSSGTRKHGFKQAGNFEIQLNQFDLDGNCWIRVNRPRATARSNRKQAKRNVTKSKHRTIPFVPMESDEQLGRLQLFCGFGYQFPIACVERQTGRVVWCTDVWAVRRGFCSGSPNIHYVEVVASRDSLFVFGAEVCGMYVESFDKTSGASICRLCTSYWGNPSESWRPR
jgi:hypothetical protein